jgi:hypothetical protein
MESAIIGVLKKELKKIKSNKENKLQRPKRRIYIYIIHFI